MRTALLVVCSAGLLACTVAWVGLTLAPRTAERHVRSAVISLLKEDVSRRLGVASDEHSVLDRVQEGLRRQIDAHRSSLEAPTTDVAAAILARACHYDCGTQAELASALRRGLGDRIGELDRATERIRGWAASRYSTLVTRLVLELRVFTARGRTRPSGTESAPVHPSHLDRHRGPAQHAPSSTKGWSYLTYQGDFRG